MYKQIKTLLTMYLIINLLENNYSSRKTHIVEMEIIDS